MTLLRFDIELLPFIALRQKSEEARALRARKRKKVRKIPLSYISTNRMWAVNKRTGTLYLSTEGEQWKQYVSDVLYEQSGSSTLFDGYDVTYVFYHTREMMYTRAGEIHEVDVSNYLKATEDALFEWLLESDAFVFDIKGYKRVIDKNPKLVILMSESNPRDVIHHRDVQFTPEELYDAP